MEQLLELFLLKRQKACVDTRLLEPHSVFFALKGNRVDGHDFLQEAVKKGASAVVISQKHPFEAPIPVISVEDPLAALQNAAKKKLEDFGGKILGITGSIGKTTTKEFIAALLKAHCKIAFSKGSANSQIGLPLTILNDMKGDEEYLILEMGMNGAGQIKNLVEIAPPDIAILTSVHLVHAGNFSSLEEIFQAKAEIFSHPKTKLAIVNRDIHLNFETKITVSLEDAGADYYRISDQPFIVSENGEKKDLGRFPLMGSHNQLNFLFALSAARYLGMGWEEIKARLPTLSLLDKRLEYVKKNGIHFFNDTFNASEVSVKAALASLPQAEKKGSKIAVLGSMLELGKFSEECHQRVGEFALNYVDTMICLGKETLPIVELWKKAGKPVEWFGDRSELSEYLKKILKEDDVVLVKGSRSLEMWKLIEEMEVCTL